MTHTPGPWFHCHGPYADVRAGDDIWSGQKIANTMFAELKGNGPLARERYERRLAECRANARLIAAAPDMLAALEYLVSLGGGDALDPARAAISKARGGE